MRSYALFSARLQLYLVACSSGVINTNSNIFRCIVYDFSFILTVDICILHLYDYKFATSIY